MQVNEPLDFDAHKCNRRVEFRKPLTAVHKLARLVEDLRGKLAGRGQHKHGRLRGARATAGTASLEVALGAEHHLNHREQERSGLA